MAAQMQHLGAGGEKLAPPMSLEGFFAYRDRSSLHLPFEAVEAILAAGVNGQALATLILLYRYVPHALLHGNVNEMGEVLIWPRIKDLAQQRGVTTRTIRNHLDELDSLGAIRRNLSTGKLWVKPVEDLYQRLINDEVVREKVLTRNPFRDSKVVSLVDLAGGERERPGRIAEKGSTSTETLSTEAETGSSEPKPESPEEWIEMQRKNTKKLLEDTLSKARQDTEKAAAKRKSKKSYERMGGGKKNKNTTPYEYTAAGLAAYLDDRITTSLKSFYQPTITKQDLKLLRMLREETDGPTVRKVIEFVTDPTSWARLRKKCRITSQVPTVGVLWGFRATIIPMALEMGLAKRSGGADPVHTSETPKPQVDTDDRDGFFA